MGQINQLLWPMETSGASGEEEVGWRRGGGMCGVTGTGRKGETRGGEG